MGNPIKKNAKKIVLVQKKCFIRVLKETIWMITVYFPACKNAQNV